MDTKMLKAGLAEFVGTFILVFIGAAAVASNQGVVTAALAHGLALLFIVYTYGHVSGAHVNPAVTLGVFIARKISALNMVMYWVAQLIGALVAALLLRVILGAGSPLGETTGSLTDAAPWMAAIFEAVLTFFLVSSVIQTAVYGKAGNLAGVAIGLTLGASILAGGTYTGASLNPARTLGPALVAGHTAYLLPYLVGIFAGGALAGVVQGFVFGE
jgi:MIP family channel proteins